ncbi:hypothetical protein D3C87_1660410 [compost metagenome]
MPDEPNEICPGFWRHSATISFTVRTFCSGRQVSMLGVTPTIEIGVKSARGSYLTSSSAGPMAWLLTCAISSVVPSGGCFAT